MIENSSNNIVQDTNRKMLDYIITVIAIFMVIWAIISTQRNILAPMQNIVIHGGLAVILIYLRNLKNNSRLWPFYVVMLFLTIISIGYILIEYPNLIQAKDTLNSTEIVIGIILFIVFFEATREVSGWIVPGFTLIALVYLFFGTHLPYPFWHPKIPLGHIVSYCGIGLHEGIVGAPLTISANFVFLFVIYGALLGVAKADDFFMEVGKVPSKWFAGGPGMTAVISSALVGTASGSAQANVAITGAFTIPMMKKIGYTPAQAGGIEAAASTGGSIMPPVMGIVAFVMSQYTGIPYVRLIQMAIMPALLYYLCIGTYVHLLGKKMKIEAYQKPNIKKIIIGAPIFIFPLLVLVWLLFQGRSLRFTIFYVLISLVFLALFRKETRGNLSTWIKGITKGAILGAEIAVTLGLVGALVSFMDVSGLLIKLPGIVELLSQGILWRTLAFSAIVTIILGCALPPFASYLLAAMICVPVIIKAGVPFEIAHFFVYFYAVFALITPPIGLAVFVAAPMCGASYISTAWEAVKAGVVAWFLPIMVVSTPFIILMPSGGINTWLPNLISCLGMLLLLQIMFIGYFLKVSSVSERILAGVGALLFIIHIIKFNYIIFILGIACISFLAIRQTMANKAMAVNK